MSTITKSIAVLGVLVALVWSGLWIFATRSHDPDNPRSTPYGYLMSHTVSIDLPPHEVFDFITYQMPEYNLTIAEAHDRFEIVDGEGLTEGVTFIAEEYQEDEGVINRYLVKKAIPGEYLHYASEPSLIMEKRDGEWVQTGTCNALVWFDIAPEGEGSKVTQTILIEMPNLWTKALIDAIILGEDSNEWQDHLVEELQGLKAAMEG